jgi:hypothetical protein
LIARAVRQVLTRFFCTASGLATVFAGCFSVANITFVVINIDWVNFFGGGGGGDENEQCIEA